MAEPSREQMPSEALTADATNHGDNDGAAGSSPTNAHALPTREHLLNLPAQSRADLLFRHSEILAPMVRASTTPLRTLALSYGADLVYTEEIVDRSITTCDRVVNEELGTVDYVRSIETLSPKVQKRMRVKNEVPVILRIVPELEAGRLIYQIGTGEPDLALPAALKVCQDVDGIDVNMGCPKKFSVSGGMGSALLGDGPRACDIIKTLRRNLGELPVSAKIRLLKDDRSTVDFVRALIRAGANAVGIHAREVGDESTQPAKWDRLVNVVRELKRTENVPIIINGDLYTRNDMVTMKQKTGADGVMLARPALYNTSIFRKPNTGPAPDEGNDSTAEKGEKVKYGYSSPLLDAKTRVIQEYLRHSIRYASNHKNTKYVLCEMMNHRRTPPYLIPKLPMRFPGRQTINDVCQGKTVEGLCKLWDVSLTDMNTAAPVLWKADVNRWSAGFSQQATAVDGRKYDDRYFLDPEGLKREREAKEAGEEKKEAPPNDGDAKVCFDSGGMGKKDGERANADAAEVGVDAKRPKLK